jgi:hypothetical protein
MPRPIAGRARVISASREEKFLPCVNAPATILNWPDGRSRRSRIDLSSHGIIDLYACRKHRDRASIDMDIGPFAEFMAKRVGW